MEFAFGFMAGVIACLFFYNVITSYCLGCLREASARMHYANATLVEAKARWDQVFSTAIKMQKMLKDDNEGVAEDEPGC